ncbi:MAG: hypothetical protein EB084_18600, partial [Proteobacteria bacterium]|nr:hypothetical protein [Pseudomonadota bacterium]
IALTAGSLGGGFTPAAIVCGTNGKVYVGSYMTNQPGVIVVGGTQGARTTTPVTLKHADNSTFVIGSGGCLALDKNGNVWTSDSAHDLVTRFDSNLANPVDIVVDDVPQQIATDSQGNAWVIAGSIQPERVVKISANGGQTTVKTLNDGSTAATTSGSVTTQFVSTTQRAAPSAALGLAVNFGPTVTKPDGTEFINVACQDPTGSCQQVGTISFPKSGGIDYTFGGQQGAWLPQAQATPPPVVYTFPTSPVITGQTDPVIISQSPPVLVSQSTPVMTSQSSVPVPTSFTSIEPASTTQGHANPDGSQVIDTYFAVDASGDVNRCHVVLGPYLPDGSQTIDATYTDELFKIYTTKITSYTGEVTYNNDYGGGSTLLHLSGVISATSATQLTGTWETTHQLNGTTFYSDGGKVTMTTARGVDGRYHLEIKNSVFTTTNGHVPPEPLAGSFMGLNFAFVNSPGIFNDISTYKPSFTSAPPANSALFGWSGQTQSNSGCGPGANHLQLQNAIPLYSFNNTTGHVETTSASDICTTGFHEVGGFGGAGAGPTVVNNGDSFGYSSALPDLGGSIPGL